MHSGFLPMYSVLIIPTCQILYRNSLLYGLISSCSADKYAFCSGLRHFLCSARYLSQSDGQCKSWKLMSDASKHQGWGN